MPNPVTVENGRQRQVATNPFGNGSGGGVDADAIDEHCLLSTIGRSKGSPEVSAPQPGGSTHSVVGTRALAYDAGCAALRTAIEARLEGVTPGLVGSPLTESGWVPFTVENRIPSEGSLVKAWFSPDGAQFMVSKTSMPMGSGQITMWSPAEPVPDEWKSLVATVTQYLQKNANDKLGKALLEFWKPDGQTIHERNQGELLQWLSDNEIPETSLNVVLCSRAYTDDRVQMSHDIFAPRIAVGELREALPDLFVAEFSTPLSRLTRLSNLVDKIFVYKSEGVVNTVAVQLKGSANPELKNRIHAVVQQFLQEHGGASLEVNVVAHGQEIGL